MCIKRTHTHPLMLISWRVRVLSEWQQQCGRVCVCNMHTHARTHTCYALSTIGTVVTHAKVPVGGITPPIQGTC